MNTNRFSRRDFLRSTAIASAATLGTLGSEPSAAAERREKNKSTQNGLIDTNVYLSRWPFRRLPLDETPILIAKLNQSHVSQAWAGSFDGLLNKDVAAVNSRLAEECRKHKKLLLPFGTVNPALPGWEEDLRRCHEVHQMPGLRLYPNYHGYKLDDPAFASLLKLASKRHLIIQIALAMEDERVQHPLMRVPHVDAAPLVSILKSSPTPLILLNWWRALKSDLIKKLADTPQLYFDTATVENVGGLQLLLRQVPASRLLFGSLAPLFYYESALLRLRESVLSEETRDAICEGNARRLLAK